MSLRKRYITWRREFTTLVTGVTDHQPEWVAGDCPNYALGGSMPCAHPDILICSEYQEEWPCEVIRATAAELKRFGRTMNDEYEVEHIFRRSLLMRAAALLRGVEWERNQNAECENGHHLP